MAGLKDWQFVQVKFENEGDDGWQFLELVCSGAQQQTPAQPMLQGSACCTKKVVASGAMSVAAKINNCEIGKNLLQRNDITRALAMSLVLKLFLRFAKISHFIVKCNKLTINLIPPELEPISF